MKAKSFSLSPLLPYSSSLFFFLLLLPSSSLFLSAGLSQPKEADTEKSLLSLSLFIISSLILPFFLHLLSVSGSPPPSLPPSSHPIDFFSLMGDFFARFSDVAISFFSFQMPISFD